MFKTGQMHFQSKEVIKMPATQYQSIKKGLLLNSQTFSNAFIRYEGSKHDQSPHQHCHPFHHLPEHQTSP